jgi:diadenosine tetraphosphatase ApaH/serine/threonine PP2A family protein phosphatase
MSRHFDETRKTSECLLKTSIFSVHGGLSPELFLCDALLLNRKREIPEYGIMADITWSDPEDSSKLTWRSNSRGSGSVFSGQPVKKLFHTNRIVLVTRSHQLPREVCCNGCQDVAEEDAARLVILRGD